jgi:large subunit ribosomal protein L10
MLKAEKERIVAELAERLKSTATLFVADYRGLSVTEIDDLRTKLIEHGARFTVVKNTLTRRAAEAAGADALLALLDGPTAIAFIEADGDLVGVAKALADSARTTRILAIRGGILDGAPIGEEDVRNLATLPPVDVLRAQVIGAITAPLTTVVGLISAPVRELVGLIDARIEQLGGIEAAEAPEEEATTAEEPVAAESAPAEEPEVPAEEPAAEEETPAEEPPQAPPEAAAEVTEAVSSAPAGETDVAEATEPEPEAEQAAEEAKEG